MSFEATTLAALRTNSALTALVPAAKIYFGKIPQGTAFPFIGCFRVSTQNSGRIDNQISGRSRQDNINLQVTVYCETEPRAHAAAAAIRKALEYSSNDTNYIFTDQRGTFDDPTELQGQILTFSCWSPSTAN